MSLSTQMSLWVILPPTGSLQYSSHAVTTLQRLKDICCWLLLKCTLILSLIYITIYNIFIIIHIYENIYAPYTNILCMCIIHINVCMYIYNVCIMLQITFTWSYSSTLEKYRLQEYYLFNFVEMSVFHVSARSFLLWCHS